MKSPRNYRGAYFWHHLLQKGAASCSCNLVVGWVGPKSGKLWGKPPDIYTHLPRRFLTYSDSRNLCRNFFLPRCQCFTISIMAANIFVPVLTDKVVIVRLHKCFTLLCENGIRICEMTCVYCLLFQLKCLFR